MSAVKIALLSDIHGNLTALNAVLQEISDILSDCQADLICMGHTHMPMDKRIGSWHVVNLGSISNPPGDDLRASYIYLTADSSGYAIEHRNGNCKVLSRIELE